MLIPMGASSTIRAEGLPSASSTGIEKVAHGVFDLELAVCVGTGTPHAADPLLVLDYPVSYALLCALVASQHAAHARAYNSNLGVVHPC